MCCGGPSKGTGCSWWTATALMGTLKVLRAVVVEQLAGRHTGGGNDMAGLVLGIRIGERVRIQHPQGDIWLSLDRATSGQARLRLEGPTEIRIDREIVVHKRRSKGEEPPEQ